ncbi:MAG TPA: acetylxylan esterase, partial [Dyadobacter sp.]|nr:acetylxylan esterase [Dyadobacter sp.]
MKTIYLALTLILAIAMPLTTLAQNYDESKVAAYTLPDPLVGNDKKVITTTSEWENERRPEILRLFEDYVYGEMPKSYDEISFKVVNQNDKAMSGKATLKEVQLTVTQSQHSVGINVVLFIPNSVKKPARAFLLINNRSPRNTLASRDSISGFWPAEQLIGSGYAIAAFHYADAAPDHQDQYQNGVLRLYPELAKADNGMKAVGAWA